MGVGINFRELNETEKKILNIYRESEIESEVKVDIRKANIRRGCFVVSELLHEVVRGENDKIGKRVYDGMVYFVGLSDAERYVESMGRLYVDTETIVRSFRVIKSLTY